MDLMGGWMDGWMEGGIYLAILIVKFPKSYPHSMVNSTGITRQYNYQPSVWLHYEILPA